MEQRNTCGTITGAIEETPRGPEDIVCNTILEDNVLKSGTKSLEQNTFSSEGGKCRFWSVTTFVQTREQVLEAVNSSKAAIVGHGWNTEVCPVTGREHEQGWVEYRNPVYFGSVRKTFPGAHIERTKKIVAMKRYCEKEATRKPGTTPMKKEFIRRPVPDPLRGKELYPWQKEVMDLISTEPDDRKIYWYYSREGLTGKTSLAKHIWINNPEGVMIVNGGGKDIRCGIAKFVENHNLDVVIFSFTRTVEDYVSYQALEEVKDGLFFSGKYESGMVGYAPPHVVCIANFHPKLEESNGSETLSRDRWVIKNIGNDDDDDEGEK